MNIDDVLKKLSVSVSSDSLHVSFPENFEQAVSLFDISHLDLINLDEQLAVFPKFYTLFSLLHAWASSNLAKWEDEVKRIEAVLYKKYEQQLKELKERVSDEKIKRGVRSSEDFNSVIEEKNKWLHMYSVIQGIVRSLDKKHDIYKLYLEL